MSGQQPATRAIAPTATLRQRFGGKWKRNILIGGGCFAALLVVWMATPSAPQEKPTPVPPRPTHTNYDGGPPPPVQPAAASAPIQQPPSPTQKIEQPPAPAGMPGGDAKRPASVSFTVAPLPEYLKAKVDAAAHSAAQTASGIAFKPTTLEGTKAFTIKNPALMLSWVTTGPLICITDTLIITGATGQTPFMCHLEHDVISSSNVTLMEAGTVVRGNYQSLVGEGQNRIIAVTAQAETPNHVRIALGGPIGDQLGAAGAPGSVDSHWWPRIGGALILSGLDAGSSILQSELQKGNGNGNNTTFNLNSGGGGGGGLAQLSRELLAKTINIPPTITLPQGSRISLWLTQDIDFSESYRLESRR